MNFKQHLFLLYMTKVSSGLCMCFVPVVSDNGIMMVGDTKSNKSSSEVKPSHSPATNTTGSVEKDKSVGVGSFGLKNKHGRRSLTRYFKDVFFETSLMKKMRSKKLGQKVHRIYSGGKFIFKFKFKSESKPKKIIESIINKAPREDTDESTKGNVSSKLSSCLSSNLASNSSSALSSSMMASGRSSSASLSYVSRPSVTKTVGNNDMQANLGKGNGKGGHGFSIGVRCLLIVSLLVLVIWGKVCAIFYTSIMLLFANRWIKSIKPCPISENVVVDRCLPEIDSELYKKKIIMEGFLDRNRCRNLC